MPGGREIFTRRGLESWQELLNSEANVFIAKNGLNQAKLIYRGLRDNGFVIVTNVMKRRKVQRKDREEMKKEIMLALVLDDYKLPDKDKLWKKCLETKPEIRDNYEFVREEISVGLSPKTTIVFRFFKLIEN